MSDQAQGATNLILMTPIRTGVTDGGCSYAYYIRQRLHDLPLHEDSPWAKVPDTYLARWYLLDDVAYQGKPAHEDHLASRYLVLIAHFHGDRERFLRHCWQHMEPLLRELYGFAWGFESVEDADAWVTFAQRCVMPTGFFFNGSTGEPLAEQLKALYLRQAFTQFVMTHQHVKGAELQQAFVRWSSEHQPENLAGPTWRPGADCLSNVVTQG
ncbi:hypothetical protein NFC81_15350 [Salinispirillum sp. LH 10-3-1]|uniref:Uncharacterized protein n=1 Tax=Salinispirillum sp. LH 10-3-1 TaxID=2952525 RepID=A0AB38YF98_9GAMM